MASEVGGTSSRGFDEEHWECGKACAYAVGREAQLREREEGRGCAPRAWLTGRAAHANNATRRDECGRHRAEHSIEQTAQLGCQRIITGAFGHRS